MQRDEKVKKAHELMVLYAKSEEVQPDKELLRALDAVFIESRANIANTEEYVRERKRIVLQGLIIGCITPCSREELRKLDDIINFI